jgi:hypothetical protein
MIINHFRMRSDVDSYNLGGMGCSAGVIAVGLAQKLLRVSCGFPRRAFHATVLAAAAAVGCCRCHRSSSLVLAWLVRSAACVPWCRASSAWPCPATSAGARVWRVRSGGQHREHHAELVRGHSAHALASHLLSCCPEWVQTPALHPAAPPGRAAARRGVCSLLGAQTRVHPSPQHRP